MSMITGCPACGTMFRVVADQLKISDGWVRCGHCAEIFDATARMQPEPPIPQVESSSTSSEESVVDVPVRMLEQDAAQPVHEPSSSAPELAETRPAESAFDAAALSLTPWASPSGFGPSSQPADDSSYLPVHLVRAEVDAAAARIESLEEPASVNLPVEVDEEMLVQDVSFVRTARRKAYWRRPLVRVVLLLVLLALTGLLAAQVAVQERDRLASLQPGALPLLERLCQPLGCRIGPPRRIEAIAIDNSGFTKLRTDTYRLSVTLKNQAPLPVAVPALELTLTDSQDQPVLRRVLTPRELGAAADTIAGTADWSASAAIAVGGGAASRVAGYRLLAFYP